jgi:hypothetical protein
VSKSPRLIVIVKSRPFDEVAWKRLLIAYAYALYDQRKQRATGTTPAAKAAQQ